MKLKLVLGVLLIAGVAAAEVIVDLALLIHPAEFPLDLWGEPREGRLREQHYARIA